jgi:hypothetical protein
VETSVSRRTSGILATIALIASGLAVLGTSVPPAGAAEPVIPYCLGSSAPCLDSFKHDGTDVNPDLYRIVWNEKAPGAGFYSWIFEKYDGAAWRADMGDNEIGHTFTATFAFGSFNPRIVGGQAFPEGSAPVQWFGPAGSYRVKISASPVYRVSDCYYPSGSDIPTCPSTAGPDDETHGYLSEVVNNARWFGGTEAEHQKISGFYNLRNTDIGEGSPVIDTDPVTGNQQLVFTLANAHEDAEHVTFHGFQHLRLPNRMLREVYGIPDPDTMTARSLTTVINGGVGTIVIRPDAGHAAMLIDVTGVTFSRRVVKVRLGIIVPTKPTHLVGSRHRSTAKIYFAASQARGARPTGYLTRCTSGQIVKNVRTKYRVAYLRGLVVGRRYTCKSRAISKAGYGPWSTSIRI